MWQRPPKRSDAFRVPIRLILRQAATILLLPGSRGALAKGADHAAAEVVEGWPRAQIIVQAIAPRPERQLNVDLHQNPIPTFRK